MLKSIERHRGRYDNLARTHPFMREMMAELESELEGWMELPRDADGEPWTGEERSYVTPEGNVRALNSLAYAIRVGAWYCEDDIIGEDDDLWPAKECRHYHAPTVEEVLREFAENIDAFDGDYVAAYAERVREAVRAE